MRYPVLRICVPIALAIAVLGCRSRSIQHTQDSAGPSDVAGLRSGGVDDSDFEAGNPRLHPISVEDAGNIAQVSAQLLEHQHYLKDLDHKCYRIECSRCTWRV